MGRIVLERLLKFVIFRFLYRSVYCWNAKKPIQENKVLFVEVHGTGLSDNFRLLYRRIKKDGGYRIHTHDLQSGETGKVDYIRRCCTLLKDLADAKYVFLNDGCNVIGSIPMREETVLTQTWHACGAFKKFGFSTAELKYGGNASDLKKYPYYGNVRYVTLSSPKVAWAYEEAMQLSEYPESLKPTGVSRTDVFFQPRFIQAAKEHLYHCMPYAKGKKVVLYAPTFRGQSADAISPDQLDIQLMMKELSDEYVLVLKHHPFVKKRPKVPDACSCFAKDLTDELSIDELLCASDICITDYSSVIFEYSLFHRPMVFFAYDLDEYFDWRGFYYDYHILAPGPVFSTNEEVIDYILHVQERFDRQRVEQFRADFMSSCDGHSTERIFQMIFAGSDTAYRS